MTVTWTTLRTMIRSCATSLHSDHPSHGTVEQIETNLLEQLQERRITSYYQGHCEHSCNEYRLARVRALYLLDQFLCDHQTVLSTAQDWLSDEAREAILYWATSRYPELYRTQVDLIA
jgi:hypothetical protein